MGNPWVAVIRHPDYSNDIVEITGEVNYINVDLGADFNGTPENREVALEWAKGLEAHAADAPEEVAEWVNSYLNEMFQEWGFMPAPRDDR
jgi:hypothetical protein